MALGDDRAAAGRAGAMDGAVRRVLPALNLKPDG
jgi:hypothetical protein